MYSRKLPRTQAGFSLIEMMVVLALIGLLTAAVAVGVRRARDKGRITTAQIEIQNIVEGLEAFNTEITRYPTNEEGLDVLLTKIGGLDPILSKKGALNDPWGNPYMYRVTIDGDEPFEVSSSGMDGIPGTDDDLSNQSVE
jgi:general secretion pathway protein G